MNIKYESDQSSNCSKEKENSDKFTGLVRGIAVTRKNSCPEKRCSSVEGTLSFEPVQPRAQKSCQEQSANDSKALLSANLDGIQRDIFESQGESAPSWIKEILQQYGVVPNYQPCFEDTGYSFDNFEPQA